MTTRALHRPALRVRVYEHLAEAIRDGNFPVGSQLPTEPELCKQLGVSRTVLREALLLLEEDGLLQLRRGIGRFVLSDRPRTDPKRLRSVESLIADAGGSIEIRRTQVEVETPAHLTRSGLGVSEGAELRFWESVLHLDCEPAALTQEWSAPDEILTEVHPELPEWLSSEAWAPHTMIGRLLMMPDLESVRCTATVSPSVLGPDRAEILGSAPETAMLQLRDVLTDRSGRPLILAKTLLAPCTPALTFEQIS